jgi:hypothetical protein
LFPFVTLLESLQVDHVSHVRLHHPATRRHDDSWGKKKSGKKTSRSTQAN